MRAVPLLLAVAVAPGCVVPYLPPLSAPATPGTPFLLKSGNPEIQALLDQKPGITTPSPDDIKRCREWQRVQIVYGYAGDGLVIGGSAVSLAGFAVTFASGSYALNNPSGAMNPSVTHEKNDFLIGSLVTSLFGAAVAGTGGVLKLLGDRAGKNVKADPKCAQVQLWGWLHPDAVQP